MNTVTINGVSSDTISGLLIQSLPPVSKPKMRTQITEIDGRDGDIVTKLGFASYDKDFNIGLYGTYDVNEILAFFNADGEVIFSNEPDKVYRFQMLEQIDLERLIRFRQARVRMHTQPFKHSATESAIDATSSPVTVTNSGNIISRPTLTVRGSGSVSIDLNSETILTLSLGTNDTITINAEQMDAYSGGTLRNRDVIGNYDNLALRVGANTIGWSGTVTSVSIENYSRWI